jgi:hypothetical protein
MEPVAVLLGDTGKMHLIVEHNVGPIVCGSRSVDPRCADAVRSDG